MLLKSGTFHLSHHYRCEHCKNPETWWHWFSLQKTLSLRQATPMLRADFLARFPLSLAVNQTSVKWGIPTHLCRPLSSGARQRLNLSYFRSSNHDLPSKHSDDRILTSHFCVTYISRPPWWINNPDDCRNIQWSSATEPGAPLNINNTGHWKILGDDRS
jgi:hypothetical protein